MKVCSEYEHTLVSSKVLVQFAGVVLIKDRSKSDAAVPTQEENLSEQKNAEDGPKTRTVEEEAAEENGEVFHLMLVQFYVVLIPRLQPSPRNQRTFSNLQTKIFNISINDFSVNNAEKSLVTLNV